MDKLKNARNKINEVDKKMAELFHERMNASKEIAIYKKEHGLPIFDAAREEEVIKNNSLYISDPEIKAHYINYIKSVMDVSKTYQHRILEGAVIAYSGVEGAFANIAAKRIFPDANLKSYPDFEKAYRAVENGECDCVVLPIENSFAGEVGQVTDLMFDGSLYINAIYDLRITHNLLALKGVTLSDIKKVISHPQALSQCSKFISQHALESIESQNTAIAAKKVAQMGDNSVAAIASSETASLYGLEVIEHHINSSDTNTTRFAVFSRLENKSEINKTPNFVLMFSVNNEAGALAKAISVIGKYGFNMRVLRSRPIKKENWQYYFYAEAEGEIQSPNGAKMLSSLSKYCDKIKVSGRFSDESILTDMEE